jgi:hypothetical protein
MRLQTYRDESHSMVGPHWSIDLATITAAGILVMGFACAFAVLVAR